MKLLKFLGMTLGVCIFLVIIAFILLVTFVSPNHLKPLIVEQVKKNTEMDLVIHGDLSWTLYPDLGVKVGHIALTSPKTQQQKMTVDVDTAVVNVKLMPLLNGIIRSKGLTIENANIAWQDVATHKFYHLQHLSLHAKDINANQPFPIETSFDFSLPSGETKGQIKLNATVAMNVDAKIYTMRNLSVTGQVNTAQKKFVVNIIGDVIANLSNQTLQWNHLTGNINNMNLNGRLDVTQLEAAPIATGQVHIEPFDFKKFLQQASDESSSLQAAENAKGSLNFTASAKATTVDGDMTLTALQAANVKMTNVTTELHYKEGVLLLSPMNAKLYEGDAVGTTKIDLTNDVPHITVDMKLQQIQIEPLFKDLYGEDRDLTLAGVGNLNLQLITSGNEANQFVKNLNGKSQITINNGALKGINLGYIIDNGYATLKNKPLPEKGENQTNFGVLTGTAIIENGIIQSHDLLIDSPRFSTSGQGTINLVDQTIDYTLQSVVKKRSEDQQDDLANLYGVSVPVLISGSLQQPKIRIDTATLLKAVAKDQIKSEAKKLQEKYKSKMSNEANQLLNDLLR